MSSPFSCCLTTVPVQFRDIIILSDSHQSSYMVRRADNDRYWNENERKQALRPIRDGGRRAWNLHTGGFPTSVADPESLPDSVSWPFQPPALRSHDNSGEVPAHLPFVPMTPGFHPASAACIDPVFVATHILLQSLSTGSLSDPNALRYIYADRLVRAV